MTLPEPYKTRALTHLDRARASIIDVFVSVRQCRVDTGDSWQTLDGIARVFAAIAEVNRHLRGCPSWGCEDDDQSDRFEPEAPQ